MFWFRKSAAVIELDPPQTDHDRLAEAETECAFAESEFNLSVNALRGYNIQYEQNRFCFTNADTTFIQTLTNDLERRFLETTVRKTLDRRNRAWAARAELLRTLGRVR
jgi:hypothetical protein